MIYSLIDGIGLKRNQQNYLIPSLFANADLCRWDDQFVVATFDGPPTVDSESYNKMDKSIRDAHESQV